MGEGRDMVEERGCDGRGEGYGGGEGVPCNGSNVMGWWDEDQD